MIDVSSTDTTVLVIVGVCVPAQAEIVEDETAHQEGCGYSGDFTADAPFCPGCGVKIVQSIEKPRAPMDDWDSYEERPFPECEHPFVAYSPGESSILLRAFQDTYIVGVEAPQPVTRFSGRLFATLRHDLEAVLTEYGLWDEEVAGTFGVYIDAEYSG